MDNMNNALDNLYCPKCGKRTNCRNPLTPSINGNLYRTRFCKDCDERFITIEIRVSELYSLLAASENRLYKNAVVCCDQKTGTIRSQYIEDGRIKFRERLCNVCKKHYYTLEMRIEQCEHTAKKMLIRNKKAFI